MNFVVDVVFIFTPKRLELWSHRNRVSALISVQVKNPNQERGHALLLKVREGQSCTHGHAGGVPLI